VVRPATCFGGGQETGPTRATYQPTLHAHVGLARDGSSRILWTFFSHFGTSKKIRGVVTQQTIWLSGNCYYPPHRPPKVLSVLSYEFGSAVSSSKKRGWDHRFHLSPCFMTAGTARNESELAEIEHSHTCYPEDCLAIVADSISCWTLNGRLKTENNGCQSSEDRETLGQLPGGSYPPRQPPGGKGTWSSSK
jgi:hypothetical protein